jgi:hypothetical protein
MISESGHATFGLWIAHCLQLCGIQTQRSRQLVGHTRFQFEPQHWRIAICAFDFGDCAVSDLVAKADFGIRWWSFHRDCLAVLVQYPHARLFNRYRTHDSGLGSIAHPVVGLLALQFRCFLFAQKVE